MRSAFFIISIQLFVLTFAIPVTAFNDDSRDDTRSPLLDTLCENAQVLNDSPTLKSSCKGDIVQLKSRNAVLIKNGRIISHNPVRDFKVSRNGKVYYRSQSGPFLSNESGRLNSLRTAVIIYLVSSQGDVVYLNDQGIVFKNGKPLNQNKGKVPFQIKKSSITGNPYYTTLNLTLSRNGRAVYINDMGQLYIDQEAMSQHTAKVKQFKIDSQASVFYLDDLGRLYKNKTRLSRKPVKVKNFKLNAQGEIAYLTDGTSNNLYFEKRKFSAGSHRILSFNFTGSGEVIYTDDKRRLWKMGLLISD